MLVVRKIQTIQLNGYYSDRSAPAYVFLVLFFSRSSQSYVGLASVSGVHVVLLWDFFFGALRKELIIALKKALMSSG